jgi:uncharacterized protein (DUF2164 family)
MKHLDKEQTLTLLEWMRRYFAGELTPEEQAELNRQGFAYANETIAEDLRRIKEAVYWME